MAAAALLARDGVATLAAQYADGVISALPEVESEQQLHEGLAGAFLAFLEDALSMEDELCHLHRTGTHES